MKDVLKDDMLWLVIALALLLSVVVILALSTGADERLVIAVAGGVPVLIGAIATLASRKS